VNERCSVAVREATANLGSEGLPFGALVSGANGGVVGIR